MLQARHCCSRSSGRSSPAGLPMLWPLRSSALLLPVARLRTLLFRQSSPHPPRSLPRFHALQVLLSQVHRLRALVLLGRFLDMGAWAVDLALSGAGGKGAKQGSQRSYLNCHSPCRRFGSLSLRES